MVTTGSRVIQNNTRTHRTHNNTHTYEWNDTCVCVCMCANVRRARARVCSLVARISRTPKVNVTAQSGRGCCRGDRRFLRGNRRVREGDTVRRRWLCCVLSLRANAAPPFDNAFDNAGKWMMTPRAAAADGPGARGSNEKPYDGTTTHERRQTDNDDNVLTAEWAGGGGSPVRYTGASVSHCRERFLWSCAYRHVPFDRLVRGRPSGRPPLAHLTGQHCLHTLLPRQRGHGHARPRIFAFVLRRHRRGAPRRESPRTPESAAFHDTRRHAGDDAAAKRAGRARVAWETFVTAAARRQANTRPAGPTASPCRHHQRSNVTPGLAYRNPVRTHNVL